VGTGRGEQPVEGEAGYYEDAVNGADVIMSVYVVHLREDNGWDTVCGEPWQGWQAPGVAATERVPPHDQPRSHVDPIRQCRACWRVGLLRQELAALRQRVDAAESVWEAAKALRQRAD